MSPDSVPSTERHSAPTSAALVARLREYGGEVLHALYDDFPPGDPDTAYSNEYLCAEAALDAADHIEKLDRMAYLTIRLPRLPWRKRRG